jgi:quercetin dioxygenase-like cupin family protein
MGKGYTYIADLYREFQEIPSDGIISRTIYNDDHIKAILFGFAPGQELSEHTSSMPAVIHIVKGETKIGRRSKRGRQRSVGSHVTRASTQHLRKNPCGNATYPC